jgi:formiminoglutamase
MDWEDRYLPPHEKHWRGHAELPEDACFFQHIQLLNLIDQAPKKTADLTFALLGFKCDEGVQRDLGRAGAHEGPAAIRHQLAKLPIQSPSIHCYDAGDIVCIEHDLESSQAHLGELVSRLLSSGMRPLLVGGGHEIALGHYFGIRHQLLNTARFGMINFDAHFDMHPLTPRHQRSAATTFYEIAELEKHQGRHFDYNCIGIQHAGDIRHSFDLAKRYGTKYILADDLHLRLQEKCFDFIDRVIDENDAIYVTLSLDVFSPAHAPGVSTIQPLGLNPWHVIPLLRQIAASGKVIGYDIAEHVPRYDIDHRTAKLAASLIYEIIHHHHEPTKVLFKSI